MSAVGVPLTDAKRRVVDFLKRTTSASTQQLAEHLDVTDVAARQHLLGLEEMGLVEVSTAAPVGRGRPRSQWSLTDLAIELFPDRHGDLTVEILEALRLAVGEEGIDTLLDVRTARQLEVLNSTLGGAVTVEERVHALAERQTIEGYMAEVTVEESGALLLVEHHCPIRAAARTCHGLCRSELELFQAALGSEVIVSRSEHLLEDEGSRCAYRIVPVEADQG